MKTLNDYLRAYHKKQEKILLVHRPSNKHSWADRCYYLEEGYEQGKPYNHRSILAQEIVIEFDDENPSKNEELALKVSKRLKADSITHAMWDSGGKSIHLHFFINPKTAGSIRLLKKVVMRYYTEGLELKPDMRLAVDTHLIRAEHGVHEGTNRKKRLIFKSNNYLKDNELPLKVWQKYANGRTTVIKREANKNIEGECTCINYIVSSVDFRENHDGRERALFILIHNLKSKMRVEELTEFLIDWYKYSGGYKLTSNNIERKVRYHYNRNYGTYTMTKELLEELGKEKVLERCKVHGKGV